MPREVVTATPDYDLVRTPSPAGFTLAIEWTWHPAIALQGVSGATISGYQFRHHATPAIQLRSCSNITITGCRAEDVFGLVSATGCSNVVVDGNEVYGIVGRGRAVQFNRCTGGAISGNTFDNGPSTNAEDIINVFNSSGTQASPLAITGNRLRGGGPHTSGGGILVGDFGGSHITVADNLLIDTGAFGVGVAGGTNIAVTGNDVYGSQRANSNVGIYVWNQSGQPSSDIEVSNNRADWRNAAGARNGGWNDSGTVAGWDTNDLAATLDPDALWAARA